MVEDMRATAWHNGGPPADAAGYGIKFIEPGRDRHFQRVWKDVVLELERGEPTTVPLSPSF